MSAFAAKDFNIKNNARNYFHVEGATGNIGIGTTTPQGGLVVLTGNVGIGTWVANRPLNIAIGANSSEVIRLNTAAGNPGGTQGFVYMGFNGTTGTYSYPHSWIGGGEATGGGYQGLLIFSTRTSNSDVVPTEKMRIDLNGNVGVGTSNPNSVLSVLGGGSFGAFATSTSPTGGIITSGNVGIGTLNPLSMFVVAGGGVGIGTNYNSSFIQSTSPAGGLIVEGNVGIGSMAPGTALDVQGTTRTTGLQLSSNPSAGYVLVSGSTGIGTWMAPGTISSSAASGWSTGTGTVYNTTGSDKVGIGTTTPQGGLVVTNGNVGIGTWAPAAQMDVNGNIYVRDLNSIYFNDPAEYINSPVTGNLLLGARNTVNLVGDNNNNGSLTDAVIIFNETSTLHPLGAMLKNSNLGVGTISPGSALGVLGGISVGQYATLSAPPGGMVVPNNVGIGTTTPQGALVVTNGNVGIGTWAPNNLFQIGINQVTVNNAGNVGIGSLTPSGILDVRGGTAAASTAGRNINLTAEASGAGGNTAGGSINLAGGVGVGTGAGGSVYISSGGNRSGSITLFTPQSADATYGYGDITLNATGYGGAGHGGYLQLQGTNASGDGGDAVMRSGNGVAAYGNPGNVTISGGSAMFNTGGSVSITGGAGGATTGIGGNVAISGGAKQGAGRVGHLLLQSSGGNVGIATTTPQALFVVTNGNVGIGTWTADTASMETTGLRLIGNGAAAGSVLVSSSTGIGTWMAASTLPAAAGPWSSGTGTVYTTTGSDKIGIGTTTPQGGLVITNGNVGIGTWTTSNGSLIVASGNVGIGTLNPGVTLDITGSLRASTTMSLGGSSVTSSGTNSAAMGSAVSGSITSSGSGSFAGGYTSNSGTSGTISSTSQGSLAYGRAQSTSLNAAISATSLGSVALGFALANGSGNASLSSSGWGSVALGYANNGTLSAAGAASAALGENVQALNNNTFAIGKNVVNDLASSFMVGFNAAPALTVTDTNVGIGTITPFNKLSVAGGVGIGTGINTTFVTSTAPSGGMIIQGNVGIGTTTPQDKLIVLGGNVGIGTWTAANASLETTGLRLIGNGAAAGSVLVSGSTGIGTWMAASTLATSGAASGWTTGTGTVYNTTGSDKVGIGTTTPQGGFVVTNGNVGIGTWAPQALLDVAGTGDAYFTSNLGIGSVNPTQALDVVGTGKFSTGVNAPKLTNLTSNGFVKTGSGDGTLSVDTNTYPSYSSMTTNYLQKATSSSAVGNSSIFDNGNVGIGTTTPQGSFVVTNGNVGIGTWAPDGGLVVMNGNVGIGTRSPQAKFWVRGPDASAASMLTVSSLGNSNDYWSIANGTGSSGFFLPSFFVKSDMTGFGGTGDVSNAYFSVLASPDTTSITKPAMMFDARNYTNTAVLSSRPLFGFGSYNNIYMQMAAGGNLGIGTITAQGKLVVVGGNVGIGTSRPQGALVVTNGNVGIGTWTAEGASLETTGLRLIGNGAAAGSVLVSSSTGIGTWMAASTLATSGAASGWSTGTGTVYNTTGSDKVGIGTTTPQGGFVVTNGNVGIGTWTTPSGLTLRSSFAYYRTTTAATATTAGQTIIGVTDTSAARTVHLATGDRAPGRIVIVKDESGGAGTNNITIDGEGGETIDGAASIVISVNYGVLRVYSDGTNWFTF